MVGVDLAPFHIFRETFYSVNLIGVRVQFIRYWHILNIKTESNHAVCIFSALMSISHSVSVLARVFRVKAYVNPL